MCVEVLFLGGRGVRQEASFLALFSGRLEVGGGK